MKALGYKQKNYLLYLLFGLLVYLLYKKLFLATILLVNNTWALEKTVESPEFSNSSVTQLQNEISRYNNIALKTDSLADPANEVLDFISQSGSSIGVSVESLDPTATYPVQKYQVNTFKVTVSGDYSDLLKMIDQLEKRLQSVRLGSVRIYSQKKNSNAQKQLYAELSLQYISKA